MKHSALFAAPTLLLLASLPGGTLSQEAFRAKVALQKDISGYAGDDLVLTIGEVTIAPGATGSKHRHPGPTYVYVLEGAVEVELEGSPVKIYRVGESFYEEAHQLHIGTRNTSTTQAARILVYHLSRKGEPLAQSEK